MTQQLPVQPDNTQPAMPEPAAPVQPATAAPAQRTMIRQQGAWGLWWLTVITFSVYYLASP